MPGAQVSAASNPARQCTAPSLLKAALWYAAHGYPVFPLTAGDKIPLKGSAGFKDATTDEDKITQWWQAHPDANIGLPTGAQTGLWVLDIDAHKDGDSTLDALEAKHGKLPDTVEVLTAHGGRHMYFTWPLNGKVYNSAGRIGVGVDIRGDGGYVVVPPSRLRDNSRRYEFEASSHLANTPIVNASEWLTNLLYEDKPKATKADDGIIKEGTRNDTLARMAGGMRRPGMTPTEIEAALKIVNNSRCTPPLPDKEITRIAHSIGRYPPAAPTAADSPLVLDDAAYYGLAGDVVRTLGPHTEADPAGLLVQFKIAFGSAVGIRPHFVVEADRHGANEFCVCVGETSKARKGTAWGRIRT